MKNNDSLSKAYAFVPAMTAAAFLPRGIQAKLSQICGVVPTPRMAASAYRTFGLESYAPNTSIKRNVYASGGGYSLSTASIMRIGIETSWDFRRGTGAMLLAARLLSSTRTIYTGTVSNRAHRPWPINYNTDRNLSGATSLLDRQGYVLAIANVRTGAKTVICPSKKRHSAPWHSSDGQTVCHRLRRPAIHRRHATRSHPMVGETALVLRQITAASSTPTTTILTGAVKSETQAAIYKVTLPTASRTLLYNLENEEQARRSSICPKVFADKVPGKPRRR